jgi:hypothetical protein
MGCNKRKGREMGKNTKGLKDRKKGIILLVIFVGLCISNSVIEENS